MPVDFAGYPCDVQKLRQLADEYGFWIIEDACHAPGGSFMDSENETTKCGNGKYSDLSIFSFHPVKHIATGEGGMISTNDEFLYKKLLSLRTHGITKDENIIQYQSAHFRHIVDEGIVYKYQFRDENLNNLFSIVNKDSLKSTRNIYVRNNIFINNFKPSELISKIINLE